MFCIEITGIPPGGPARDEIKEKWIGLVLPLYASRFRMPEPRFLPEAGCRVYPVPILTALEILNLQHPEAARWWFENFEHVYSGANFLFSEEIVKVVDELPSLRTEQADDQAINMGQFLQVAEDKEDCQGAVFLIRAHLGHKDWEELQSLPFSKAAAIFLADLAQTEVGRYLDGCSMEESFSDMRKAAKKFFEELYDFTWLHGIQIEEGLIKRPVSWVDAMVDDGYLEEKDGGLVPTKKVSEEARNLEKARNAQNN